MNRLVIFEGLPGSGKSTLSARFAERLTQQGVSVRAWHEGELHPADLSWCACVPAGEWDALLSRHPAHKALLEAQSEDFAGYHIVPYTQLDFGSDGEAMERELSGYELYDGRADTAAFSALHSARWRHFAAQAATQATVNVFECVLLQNHVNEWLLFRGADEGQVAGEIRKLLAPTLLLEPLIIHLQQPDVSGALRSTGEQRPGWLPRVIDYVADSPYGRTHGLHGEQGLIEYFTYRQSLECRMLQSLPCKSIVLSPASGDWDKLLEQSVAAWQAGLTPSL